MTAEELSEVKKEMQIRHVGPQTLSRFVYFMRDLWLWIQTTIECAKLSLALEKQTRRVLDRLTIAEA